MERLKQPEIKCVKPYIAPSFSLFSLPADDILRTSLEKVESSTGDLWEWNDLF